MQLNRIGKTVEYKQGHYYLTITEWEDGHCEIEIHKCEPKLLFHTCDPKELDLAKKEFIRLSQEERIKSSLILISP